MNFWIFGLLTETNGHSVKKYNFTKEKPNWQNERAEEEQIERNNWLSVVKKSHFIAYHQYYNCNISNGNLQEEQSRIISQNLHRRFAALFLLFHFSFLFSIFFFFFGLQNE